MIGRKSPPNARNSTMVKNLPCNQRNESTHGNRHLRGKFSEEVPCRQHAELKRGALSGVGQVPEPSRQIRVSDKPARGGTREIRERGEPAARLRAVKESLRQRMRTTGKPFMAPRRRVVQIFA